MHLVLRQDVPPRAWQWTLASLNRLFEHPIHGGDISNALDSLLMRSLSQIILRQQVMIACICMSRC